jgi:hypothetical protein
MSKITFRNFVRIYDVARLIATIGDKITVVVRGEPGIGKSALLKLLLKLLRMRFGDEYEGVYLDCPTVGDGDLGMNIPDRETKRLEFMVSSLLKLHTGKKIVLMLDEYLKVNKLMKTIFTRLVQERAIGDVTLPEGSIVFATSNLSSDGVGDNTQFHEGNRVLFVEMAKPTVPEMLSYAVNNGWTSLTRTLLQMKPQLLQSYRSISEQQLSENPYIFNPSSPNVTFVSPRSIEKADIVLRERQTLGDDLTKAALAGVIGAAAAELYATFMLMEKDLIPIPDIVRNPETIPMPVSAGALIMTMHNAVDELQTQDELVKFMRFVNRVESDEYRDVFMSMLFESERTAKMAHQNAETTKWYQNNYKIMQ